jgi:hypothetical protein
MSNCRFEGVTWIADAPNSQLEALLSKNAKDLRKARGIKKKVLKGDLIENLDFGVKLFPDPFPKKIVLTLPIRTVSEAQNIPVKKKNGKYTTEHWTAKHKRHKLQKKIIFFELLPYKYLITLPCKIHYVRYAPDELDKFDNLPCSFKYINDQVCAEITGDYRPGRADSNKNITITCDQVKSKVYGVKIIIEF